MRTQQPPVVWIWLLLLIPLGLAPPHGLAQDTTVGGKASAQEVKPAEPFEMVLSYTDVTVGPGQEFAMDTVLVNPRKEKVQLNLATESIPEGWTAGFHRPARPKRPSAPRSQRSSAGPDESSLVA